MPKRTAEHVTEEKSRLAFRTVLPPEWVFREPTPDYGIDGEVEIFEDTRATGLLFKVQLKGTTQRGKLSVRLPHETAEYYSSLVEPVLIVLHHEPSNRIYARWFQSYDPHEEPPGHKSMAMKFRNQDELTTTNVGRLKLEAETHRRLRDSRSAEPLRLGLQQADELIAGVPTVAVAATLQDVASRMPDVLRLSPQPLEEDLGTITLRADGVVVSCRGLATSTIHYPVPWPTDPDLDRVVSDAFIAVALLVHRIGAVENAARLFAEFAEGSSIVDDNDALATIANAFTRTHRIHDAIKLLQTLPEDSARVLLFGMSLTWTGRIDSLSAGEQQEVVDYLLKRAVQEEAQGDAHQAAASHYTLANRLRALHRHEDAVAHYRRAAELDDTYRDRDYYLAESGGALFESGDFAGAVEMYRLGLEHGDRKHFLPLLADSLLLSGDYDSAREPFEEVTRDEECAPEWRLKLNILRQILGLGIKTQVREADGALAMADLTEALTDEERRDRLDAALQLDALCPLAWPPTRRRGKGRVLLQQIWVHSFPCSRASRATRRTGVATPICRGDSQ